jgi:predicted transcriptional regulator
MVADAEYSLVVVTSRLGTIHARVQVWIEGFPERPFTVADIAEILGLERQEVRLVIWTLLHAGAISVVGKVCDN